MINTYIFASAMLISVAGVYYFFIYKPIRDELKRKKETEDRAHVEADRLLNEVFNDEPYPYDLYKWTNL